MFVHIGAKAAVLSIMVVAETETRQTPTPGSLGSRGRRGPCCDDRRPQTNSEADGLGSRRLLLPLIWSLSWEPPSVYDGPLATPLLPPMAAPGHFPRGVLLGRLVHVNGGGGKAGGRARYCRDSGKRGFGGFNRSVGGAAKDAIWSANARQVGVALRRGAPQLACRGRVLWRLSWSCKWERAAGSPGPTRNARQGYRLGAGNPPLEVKDGE